MNLVSTLNYREFILDKIRQNKDRRGYRTQLAKAASCHSSYLSHLFKGEVQLTPDQAAALCDFWQLNKRDTEYFITLVNLERSATPSLQKKLKERLQELRQLTDKLPTLEISEMKMSYEHALQYFSNWYMSAIHRALEIPELRDASSISARLALPFNLVERTLVLLENMNLIEKVDKHWIAKDDGFNLNRNAALIGVYHASLRRRAGDSYDNPTDTNVHFSTIACISKKDCRDLQIAIKHMISSSLEKLVDSPPEELVGMCVDFFSL